MNWEEPKTLEDCLRVAMQVKQWQDDNIRHLANVAKLKSELSALIEKTRVEVRSEFNTLMEEIRAELKPEEKDKNELPDTRE